MIHKKGFLTREQALRKFAAGGYDRALAFVHPNQLQDVRLNLSIWLNKQFEGLENVRILDKIRYMKKDAQHLNIKRLKNKGIIDSDLHQKVFFKENEFFWKSSNKTSSKMTESDVRDVLSNSFESFYKTKKEHYVNILFNHIIREYTHKQIAAAAGLEWLGVRYLLASWKRNGFYDHLRKKLKEVIHVS